MNKKIILGHCLGYCLLILFLYSISFGQQIPSEPQWIAPEKQFSLLNHDEYFYFLKSQVKDQGAAYKIGFVVYSYSKQANRWRIWKYDRFSKDFLLFEEIKNADTVNNYIKVVPDLVFQADYRKKRVLGKGKIEDDQLYWITIHWNDPKQQSKINKNNLIIVSGRALRNKTNEVGMFHSDLNHIQLATYNHNHQFKEPDNNSVKRGFDVSGYAVFDYQQSEIDSDSVDRFFPDTGTVSLLQLPFTIKPYVFINHTYHHYFKNFGYINLNATFLSDEISRYQGDDLLIINVSTTSIVNSPLLKRGNKFYFYHHATCQSVCLFKKVKNYYKPLGYLTSTSRKDASDRESFMFKPFSEHMRQANQSSSITSQFLSLLNQFNEMGPIEQKKFLDHLCATNNICRQSIKNLGHLEKSDRLCPQNLETQFSMKVPFSQWTIESNENQNRTCFHKNNKQCCINLQHMKNITKEKLNLNSSGKSETYYKIPVYPSKGFYYYTEQLTNTVQLKQWMIFDDFFSQDSRHSILLNEFKHSSRLIDEILQNNPFSRIDVMKAAKVIKISLNYRFYDYYHPYVSEITSLIDLTDHSRSLKEKQWELHLFVAENTRGFNYQLIISPIVHRLKQLNVKRIHVWEFCDRKEQLTQYKRLFTRISKEGNFEYKHHHIWAINQFQKVMR